MGPAYRSVGSCKRWRACNGRTERNLPSFLSLVIHQPDGFSSRVHGCQCSPCFSRRNEGVDPIVVVALALTKTSWLCRRSKHPRRAIRGGYSPQDGVTISPNAVNYAAGVGDPMTRRWGAGSPFDRTVSLNASSNAGDVDGSRCAHRCACDGGVKPSRQSWFGSVRIEFGRWFKFLGGSSPP